MMVMQRYSVKAIFFLIVFIMVFLAGCQPNSPTPTESAPTLEISSPSPINSTPISLTSVPTPSTPTISSTDSIPQPQTQTMYVRVDGTGLNVRERPDAASKQIGFLFPDDALSVIHFEGEWAFVYCLDRNSGKSKNGYVNSQYLSANLLKKADYSYKIKTIIDKTEDNVTYKFSRPFFEETSNLAKTINQVYNQTEEKFENDMSMANNSEISDATLMQICKVSYEKNGIISFCMDIEWYLGAAVWSPSHYNTFDFNIGRQLRIDDFLLGTEEQIIQLLEKEVTDMVTKEWGAEALDEVTWEEVRAQSGLAANFSLDDKGIRVWYTPPTISYAFHGSADVFIPWTRTDIVRPLEKS